MRRVGVLIPFPDDRGPLVKDNLSAFKQRLHELGWDEGRNIRFDYRFTGQVPDRMRAGSEELIALAPDIIVVWANPAAAIVRKATQAIPIIFVNVSDPVGGGFVANLARPGGNITGFQNFETAIGGKWLQVLKEIAPGVRRVAFVHSPDVSAHVEFVRTAQAASSSLGVTATPASVRTAEEIGPTLRAFASAPMEASLWLQARSTQPTRCYYLLWLLNYGCPQSIRFVILPRMEAWLRMVSIRSSNTGAPPLMLTVY